MLTNAAARPLRVPKVAELIAAKIRAQIVRGDLKSGELLPSEAELIEMFAVSRPTLREAIRILEFEKLINVTRGAKGGARVQSPTLDDFSRAMGMALQARRVTLGDIYQARMLIEPQSAKFAAENRPKEAAAVLREHIRREEAALQQNDIASAESADFHRLLLEQSGNQTLAVMALALKGLVEKHHDLAMGRRQPEEPETRRKRARLAVRSHERLVDLIEEGNGPGAEQHWLNHMRKAGELWPDRFAETSIVDILDM